MLYYSSEQGYYFKKYNNGNVKRVSEKEYSRNIQVGGRMYKCMKDQARMPKGNNVKFVESVVNPSLLKRKYKEGWICQETDIRASRSKQPGCHMGHVDGMVCIPCGGKKVPKVCRACPPSIINKPEVFYCKNKSPMKQHQVKK